MDGLSSRTDGSNPYLTLPTGSADSPSPARVYEYFLGGAHNFAIDREFAEDQARLWPGIGEACRQNRAFLRRAVHYAVGRGITQFLDIGSGIPTAGNVHEAADAARADRTSRVVYVDCDPIAVQDARSLLAKHGDPSRHAALDGNFLNPEHLWPAALDTGLIDPEAPLCLLTVALLHFITPEQDPYTSLAWYRAKLAPGSLLILSHGVAADPRVAEVARAYEQRSTSHATARARDDIARFFGDFRMISPGLTWAPLWHPDGPVDVDTGSPSAVLAGVAEKP